jgi:hypothetical protein
MKSIAFGAHPDDIEFGVGSHPVKYMRTFNLGSDEFVFSVAVMIQDGPKITTDTLSTIRTFHRSFETILSILSLILLIPINIANADDPAYDYGFEEGVAVGLAMDDSSSSKITDCSPMVDHIKIAKRQAGWQQGYSQGIMLE